MLVLACCVGTASADNSYSVAGVTDLFGDNWTQHALSDEDGDGIFTFEVEQTLTKGTGYEFKFVMNESDWNTLNGSNRSFSVQADGKYKIIFEVNDNNVKTYYDKSYACNAYGIMEPTSVVIYGNGITSTAWGSTNSSFTQSGNSWIYNVDETVADVYFHIKINNVEYSPSTNKWFNASDGWTLNIKNWADYIDKAQSFALSSFTSLPYSRYEIKVTPYHDNLYIEVSPFEKVTTNGSGYATFTNNYPLSITGATAYYATDNNDGSATAISITNPAASTPMIIKGVESTTYYFAVAETGTDYSSTNAFHAGSGSALGANDGGGYNYILKGDAFYLANGNTVATNKAYLKLSEAATAKALIFMEDEETDGIKAVQNSVIKGNGEVYNLAGQRVAKDYKGIVIKNGKKYMNK